MAFSWRLSKMGEWRDELSKRVLVVVIKKAKCFNRVNNFLLARSDLDDSFNSLCLAIAFTKSPITSEMFNEKIEEMSNYMAEADSKKDKQASRLRMIAILLNAVIVGFARPPFSMLVVETVLFGALLVIAGIIIEKLGREKRFIGLTREWIELEEQKAEYGLRLVIDNEPTLLVAP